MGVSEIPNAVCTDIKKDTIWCRLKNAIIEGAVYNSVIQNTISPAGYFRDTRHYDSYL